MNISSIRRVEGTLYLDCIYQNIAIYLRRKGIIAKRESEIQFDIVIEARRQGRENPSSYVVFECKNYKNGVPEACVTDFSDKLGRIFKHAAKGVLVVSSRLQSGAESLARSRSIGIVKYDENGLEVVADRNGHYYLENRFVKSQIFQSERPTKALKFSAFYNGKFFGNISHFLLSLETEFSIDDEGEGNQISVPYLSAEYLEKRARDLLEQADYKSGAVDLKKICAMMSIELQFSEKWMEDGGWRWKFNTWIRKF